MLSKVLSLGLSGVNGYEVQTECYIGTGLPAFDLVGLPDASVKEARERVRAAIKNCGFRFPHHREPRSGGYEEIRHALRSADPPVYSGCLRAGKASEETLRVPR